METPSEHKLVEQSQLGPASPHDDDDDPKTTSLPLTFLDLPLAGPIYARRQFFYNFPYSTHDFYQTTLPNLKRSLSLTLQRFFPLAGNLLCPPPPHKPFIRCTNEDTVTFTIIESSSEFNHLSSNNPKSLKDLDHLVPKLTCKTMHDDDNTLMFPLVALQATVFPNRGLCIAITYCHVMDGRCCGHFMKFWSSLCASGGVDLTLLEKSPPCFDRELLKDPKGLEPIFLRDYFKDRLTWKEKLGQSQSVGSVVVVEEDQVKATVVFGREDIEGMKRFALNQLKKSNEFKEPQYLSKFVVTCAFVWSSLVKTRHRDNNDEEENMKEEHFQFAADCRDRLEYPIPATYFGNCLTRCHATLKRMDLKGEGGFVNAVKVIEGTINDMKTEPFRGAEDWNASFTEMFVLGRVLLVTGSPKFGVYETDFGFGRPTKAEMVHSFKAMSLAESGDKEGGVEVGVVLRWGEFENFVAVVERGLETFKSGITTPSPNHQKPSPITRGEGEQAQSSGNQQKRILGPIGRADGLEGVVIG